MPSTDIAQRGRDDSTGRLPVLRRARFQARGRLGMTAIGTGRMFQTVAPRLSTESRLSLLLLIAIFVSWAAVVAVGVLHHEFWRDEVRALTLALQANSLWSVPTTVHGEGHPALWYILLRGSYDVFHTKAVLPMMSVTVAAAAVLVFLWRAPFPLWWKAFFVFSAIPLY